MKKYLLIFALSLTACTEIPEQTHTGKIFDVLPVIDAKTGRPFIEFHMVKGGSAFYIDFTDNNMYTLRTADREGSEVCVTHKNHYVIDFC